MFGLAVQVMQRRWLLSISLVVLMALALLNTTATLGLVSYVGTGYSRAIDSKYTKASYYLTEDTTWQDIEQSDPTLDTYGFSKYWQSYGISRLNVKYSDAHFSFLPIKVIEHSPSWRLPLMEGLLPQAHNDVMINQFMSSTYGISIGEKITLMGYATDDTFKVCGIIEDSHYENNQIGQQRVFVGYVDDGKSDGYAFDLKEPIGTNITLVDKYLNTHKKPLIAEYIASASFRDAQKQQMYLPFLIVVVMWFLQLLLIVYIVYVILKQLILHYPHSMLFLGHQRFDHLDVYLNYLMLLLILAFTLSVFVLRPYLAVLTASLELDLSQIEDFKLFLIHGVGMGFWMNLMIVINTVLQRLYIHRRSHKGLFVTGTVPRFGYFNMTMRLLGLLFINTIIALLLLLAFTSSHWSNELVKHPSIWGFTKEKVALNVAGNHQNDNDVKGYSYQPVVVENNSLIYAKGVVSNHGFEYFGIQLISGRLPQFPNEIVVGRGLVDNSNALGEHLRFYDGQGTLHLGVIVGIGNAALNNGKILGFMAPSEKTFVFNQGESEYTIDYASTIKRQYRFILNSIDGFVVPLISSMVFLGLGVLGLFYSTLGSVSKSYRQLLGIANLRGSFSSLLIILFSSVVVLFGEIIAYGIWGLILLPLINQYAASFGIEFASLEFSLINRVWVMLILLLFNILVNAGLVSYNRMLLGSGFLER